MPQAVEQLRVDPFLTDLSLSYGNEQKDYIADRVSPRVPVAQRSGKIRVWSKANDFRVDSDLAPRRPGTKSSRIDISMLDQTYACETYARHVMVSLEDMDEVNGQIDLEMENTERLTNRMLALREVRTANALTSAITGAGNVLDLSTYLSGAQQFDVANSNPLTKILPQAIRTIYNAIGVTVNQMILPYDVAVVLRNHTEYLQRFYYWKDTIEDLELANRILGMEPVVARAQQNTAARSYVSVTPDQPVPESQDENITLAPIWGNSIILLYTPNPAVHRIGKSTLCTTKSLWIPGQSHTKKWMKDDYNSIKIEQQQTIVEQVTAPLTGFVLKNVLANP